MVNETVQRTSLEDMPLYRAVLEGMGAGVVVLSIRGDIEYLNPACEKLLGLDLLEVRGEPLRDYVASSDEMDRLAELRPHILRTGKWDGELRLTRRDGEAFTIRCTASLLRDGDGEPSAIVVVAEELDADNRTEAALMEALEQFRALAECMPSLVRFNWNDGRPAWYNPRFLEFSGLSYRELERGGWRALIHPDDVAMIPAAREREPWQAEIRMRRHDGQYRWMMVRTANVHDARGKVIGFVGIAADIHDRLVAERESMAAHQQLDAIWETSPIGLGLLDADLRFVRVNETMATMGGVPAKEWTGKLPHEVLGRVADHFREFSQELKATGQPILRREREFEIDGELFSRLDSWVPLRDASGALTGVAVSCEDITAQKRAHRSSEDALRELDGVYQSAPIGLAVMDRKMRFVRVNERLAKMNGMSVADHIGKRPAEVVPEAAAQAVAEIKAVLERGEPVIGLQLTSDPDGDTTARRYYMENWIPLKNDAGDVVGMSIAVEDVTDLKRAQQAAEQSVRELDAVFEAVPVGLGVLDRDIRWKKINPELERMSRVPASEIVGKDAATAVPRAGARVQEALAVLGSGGTFVRREREVVIDGDVEHRLDSVVPIRDEHGNVLSLVVASEDITSQKLAQKAAEDTLRELEALYRGAPIGLAVMDREMRFVRVNDRLAELNGITAEEHVGRRSVEVPSCADEAATAALTRVLEHGETVMGLELTGEVRGERRHYRKGFVPLRDASGQVIGASIAVEDVTAQKRAQRAAEHTSRELEALYQGAPIGLAVLDREGRFIRVNERLSEMTGIPMADHLGKTPSELIPLELDNGTEAWDAVIERAEAVVGLDVRAPILGSPGKHRHYRQNWVPLKGVDGAVVGVSVAVEDVTERQHAETAMRTSRERLQRVLDVLPEAVVISNSQGEVTFADQQWAERTGLDPATSSVEEMRELIHPEDRGRIEERWLIAHSSGRPFTATYRTRHPDGTYRWQLSRAVPLLDGLGEVSEWIGTLADIDDVKQNQEALATALAELDITYQTAPVGLGVLDLDLRYIRLNEQLAAVAGLPVEELIGKSVPELVPDIADAVRDVRDQIVATGEAVIGVETEGFAPGPAEYRYCLENWIPIKDEDGNVVAISVSVEDVTSLKRAKQELDERLAELDAVFQATAVGLALLDREMRFVRVNERFAELNGVAMDEHLGRTMREVLPLQGDYAAEMGRRALAGERIVGDMREVEVGHVRRWRQVGWVPVRDKAGEIAGIGLAVEDVTPLKRAELRLQAALAELSTTYRFAPVGLAVFDTDGRFVRVNEQLARMHGVPAWEHIGRSSADVLGRERDWARDIVRRAAATEEPLLGLEVSTAIPAGSEGVKHLRVSCAPMRNHRNEVFAVAAAVEDITDMKENESLLMASEQRLRAILDAVPAAVGVTDPEGRLAYLNRHWLEYSGMELVGVKTADLAANFHPDEVEAVISGWTQSMEHAEPFEVLQRLKRADGAYRWHLGRTVPMRGAGGEMTGWVSTNIDIHDRKCAEEQLETALAEIEATYQGAPIGLAVVDRELRYVRVNEVLAAANGMPAWRHVGRELGAVAHCNAQDVERVTQEVLATGEARLNVELASQPRRGRAHTWRFNMMPLRDAQRAIIGVSIAAEDVTTRKRADDQVRAAKDQLRRILDNISAPVIVLDEDGLLRFGNRQFWEYTGLRLDPEHAHPMEPLAEGILHPDEREGVLAGYRGALERIEGFQTVCRLRRYDGEYRWHMGAAMAVPPGDDGKRQWVATYMDFQDRKQAEEALQAANRVKDEFLGMVSHELRTPLTTVLGLADMLQRRMDEMDRDTRAEALDQLQEDAKRLNELIENMLLLSRAEQVAFEPEPVLLQRVAPMVLAAAAERHRDARWEMDLPEELPPVAGKAGWLEQVLQNLVTNSVKYSKGSAHVRVEARRAGADIELRVLDSGRGVRADEAELMFEPFYRSRSASGQPGLGLGLAVCRRLVELMGGQISASPRAGGGTVVTIRLRCATGRVE